MICFLITRLIKQFGVGSFLGGIFRSVLPLIRKGLPVLTKELMKSSAGILNDVVDSGGSFKESFRKRGRESIRNLANETMRSMSGSGLPPKKRHRVQSKSSTRVVKKSLKKAPPKKSTKAKKSATKSKKLKKSKVPSDARFAYL